MATKEKWRTKAARMREEARETGKVILRAPALVRTAECAIRFLLGALLSGAEIFGGYAPFGLGLVAASGSGIDGFCALVGACFGYLSFQGFAEGLRYAAACILAFSLAFAFFDVKAYRKSWFMPLAAAGMDGITGFVYLSDRGWSPESLIFFGTELLLCGASAYFYRVAFTPWTEKREEEALTPRQTVSLLILGGTLLLTLSRLTLLWDLSTGRLAAAVAVMAAAYAGGIARHYAASGYGPGRVRQELQKRGVPRELWDDVLAQLPDSADAIDGFLKKKLGGRTPDRAALKKLSDALLRRGFSWSDIRPALNRLGEEIDE